MFARGVTSKPEASGWAGRKRGIGLALVRLVTAQHGGHVEIDDAPGGGASFVVRLPAAGARRRRPRMRDVLIVDDDFMVAEIHRRFVERIDGFPAGRRWPRTGAEALAAAAGARPHLILLDDVPARYDGPGGVAASCGPKVIPVGVDHDHRGPRTRHRHAAPSTAARPTI